MTTRYRHASLPSLCARATALPVHKLTAASLLCVAAGLIDVASALLLHWLRHPPPLAPPATQRSWPWWPAGCLSAPCRCSASPCPLPTLCTRRCAAPRRGAGPSCACARAPAGRWTRARLSPGRDVRDLGRLFVHVYQKVSKHQNPHCQDPTGPTPRAQTAAGRVPSPPTLAHSAAGTPDPTTTALSTLELGFTRGTGAGSSRCSRGRRVRAHGGRRGQALGRPSRRAQSGRMYGRGRLIWAARGWEMMRVGAPSGPVARRGAGGARGARERRGTGRTGAFANLLEGESEPIAGLAHTGVT